MDNSALETVYLILPVWSAVEKGSLSCQACKRRSRSTCLTTWRSTACGCGTSWHRRRGSTWSLLRSPTLRVQDNPGSRDSYSTHCTLPPGHCAFDRRNGTRLRISTSVSGCIKRSLGTRPMVPCAHCALATSLVRMPWMSMYSSLVSWIGRTAARRHVPPGGEANAKEALRPAQTRKA